MQVVHRDHSAVGLHNLHQPAFAGLFWLTKYVSRFTADANCALQFASFGQDTTFTSLCTVSCDYGADYHIQLSEQNPRTSPRPAGQVTLVVCLDSGCSRNDICDACPSTIMPPAVWKFQRRSTASGSPSISFWASRAAAPVELVALRGTPSASPSSTAAVAGCAERESRSASAASRAKACTRLANLPFHTSGTPGRQ
eukprot:1221922-Pleurochrysis_carterae.AAC.5